MGYYDEAILAHHGILGQKWGVRRFENKNGHLTAAGLKRYEDGRKVTEKEKHAFSAKAAGYKVLATAHTINSKTAMGKKNRQIYAGAAKMANKQAEKAQKEADAKKAEKEVNKKTLTPEQKKKIIGVGLAVAGTALAAYGGYKLYQLNKEVNNTSDMLNAQKKDVAKTLKKYTNDRIAWEKKTINLESQKRMAENIGNAAKVAKIEKKLASSPPPLPTSHSKAGVAATNKLAAEASALARSVTAQGPINSSKPAQNANQIKSQMIAQKYQAATRTISSGSKTTSNTLKVAGQQKFIDASKANDDLVQELLKKNTLKL